MRVKEDLEQALALAVQMREAQREYFRTRTQEALIRSKTLEKKFDAWAATVAPQLHE